MKSLLTILIGLGFLLGAPPLIGATPIAGDGPLGYFSGSFDYFFLSDNTAKVTVVLKNTSPSANGGYMTGFAFNNPDNLITDVDFFSSDKDFGLLGGSDFQNKIKGDPFGRFDIGVSVTKQLLGGGSPVPGIPVGATETFSFFLTGSKFSSLNTASFINETSEGKNGQFFLARFRGFDDDGSYKTPGSPVPEPATILLLISGILGLAGMHIRHQSKK